MIPRIPKDDRDNSFNYNDSFKYSTNDKEDFKGRHVLNSVINSTKNYYTIINIILRERYDSTYSKRRQG